MGLDLFCSSFRETVIMCRLNELSPTINAPPCKLALLNRHQELGVLFCSCILNSSVRVRVSRLSSSLDQSQFTYSSLVSFVCFYMLIFTVRNSSCRKVMFSQASVSHSVHRGACMTGGVCGRGLAWWGGMCLRGACMAEGMYGGGHAW